MMRSVRGLAGVTMAGVLVGAAGCGALLGLDEFTNQGAQLAPSGAGGSDCAAPEDCQDDKNDAHQPSTLSAGGSNCAAPEDCPGDNNDAHQPSTLSAGGSNCVAPEDCPGVTDDTDPQTTSSGGIAGCAAPEDCPSGENGTATCAQGTCGFTCANGFDDCDGEIGCETPTLEDEQNCGGCGKTCSTYCVGGSCNAPIDVVAGATHACALLEDGSVYCWGVTPDQETNNPNVIVPTPVAVELPGPAIQLAAASYVTNQWPERHTCALLRDGTVHCWGTNSSRQLGIDNNGRIIEKPNPVAIADVDTIAAGGTTTCAIDKGGRLLCWGGSGSGQLGLIGSSSTPVHIPVGEDERVAQVSVGVDHLCALTEGSALYCWGANHMGQLGEVTGSQVTVPTRIGLAAGHKLTAVSCGYAHTCALTAIGPYCWGMNHEGQLGIGSDETEVTRATPVRLNDVGSIYAGYEYTGALVGGNVFMWGRNSSGQYGSGNAAGERTPKDTGLTGIRKLALGMAFACGLTEERVVLCWGDGRRGQLGNGTGTSTAEPTPVVWP